MKTSDASKGRRLGAVFLLLGLPKRADHRSLCKNSCANNSCCDKVAAAVMPTTRGVGTMAKQAEKRHEGGVSYHIPGKDYFEKRELRRHAGVFSLWALGVGAVISGD